MKLRRLEWRIVLVRPRNPLNIGAAARAMANFGFADLVVVAPYNLVWQETRSAVGAEHIVRQAEAVRDLQEAIGDRTVVVGATSGSRRFLDRELLPLTCLPEWLGNHPTATRAALLFGSEKTGLSNEDLSHCHVLVRIPTLPDCPSMNLGQAVAVCCYELARRGRLARACADVLRSARYGATETRSADPKGLRQPRIHLSDPAPIESLERVFERAVRVLDQAGYLKPKSRAATLIKLRRQLLGRGLTNNDAKILGGALAQIEWKLAQF
jgi:tRNA/rRNA methyltransferase